MKEVLRKGIKISILIILSFLILLIFFYFLQSKNEIIIKERNMTAIAPRGVTIDYEVSEKNIIVNFTLKNEKIAEVELIEPEKVIINSKLAKSDESYITTDVFAIKESFKLKEAKITLPKRGIVQAIFYCQEYDFANEKCENWQPTNISFEQTKKTITFKVNHFTAYAGGALNNSMLVIWDETDEGMPYGNQARQPGNNTFFFANYTNTTSGLPIDNSSANLSINFSDSISASMSYNSTLKLWVFNRTFSLNDTYFFSVNATAVGYDNLTATDSVLIDYCVSPHDDFYVNSDVRFCFGDYSINDSGAQGIIIINSSNVVVDFTNATIRGNNSGTALYSYNFSNITIRNFKIFNYSNSVFLNYGNDIDIKSGSCKNIHLSSLNNTKVQNLLVETFSITSSYNTILSFINKTPGYANSVISVSNNTQLYNSTIWTDDLGYLEIYSSNNTLMENVYMDGPYNTNIPLYIQSSQSLNLINFSLQGIENPAIINVTDNLRIINSTINNTNPAYDYKTIKIGDIKNIEVISSYLPRIIGIYTSPTFINASFINSSILRLDLYALYDSNFLNNTILNGGYFGNIYNSTFILNNFSDYFYVYDNFSNSTLLNNLFDSLSSGGNSKNILLNNNTFSGSSPYYIYLRGNNIFVLNNSFRKKIYLGVNHSEISGNILHDAQLQEFGFNIIGNNNTVKDNRIINITLGYDYNGAFVLNLTNSKIHNISTENINGTALIIKSDILIENSTLMNSSYADLSIWGVVGNFKNVVMGPKIFSYGGLFNATNITLRTDYAAINYDYVNISVSTNKTINLSYNLISINSSANPDLNKSAKIFFYNLPYTITPFLLKDGIRCDNDTSLCNITNYDYASGTLEAYVSSFSDYTTTGQTCMNISDDTYIIKNTTLCSGIYTIEDSSGDGIIIINASGIILNCNNARITGNNSGIGISIASKNNNIIYNCDIRNYTYGVYLQDSSNNIVRNSRFYNNNEGVSIQNSSDTTINSTYLINNTIGIMGGGIERINITKSNFSGNSYTGVLIFNSRGNNSISNNSITNNFFGVIIDNNTYNENILNNILEENLKGIYINNSEGARIASNNISQSEDALIINNSKKVNLTNNVLINNEQSITIDNSSVTLIGNNFSNNSYSLTMRNSLNSTIGDNSVLNSTYSGINISDSLGIIILNTTIDYGEIGILIQNSSSSSLNSTRTSNNNLGIYLSNSNITGNDISTTNSSGYSFFCENSAAKLKNILLAPHIFIDSNSLINATQFILGNKDAMVNYSSILITNEMNTTDNLFLEYNLAGINSNNLPQLNISADITFYSLTYSATPYVLKDGVRCDNDSSLCIIKSYDNTTGTLLFNVSSFTNYTTITSNVPGTPDTSPPTQPTVVDGYNYVDYDWTSSNNTLYASWFGSTDRSKIFYYYRIMVNSTSCYNNSCTFKYVGEDTKVAVENLTLQECLNYSFEVLAEDTFYNVANVSSSDGIVTDFTPPVIYYINSTTHPNQENNYTNDDVEFNWNASDIGNCPSGVDAFSYVLDNNNETIPDDIPELFNQTNVTIKNIPNGVWYFHLKARDRAGLWSDVSTFKVSIQKEGVYLVINGSATPTTSYNISVSGAIIPANGTYLLKLYVNNRNIQNKTISNSQTFSFEEVPLSIGMNRIFVSAFVNEELEAVSNSIYVERINETRVNVSSFTIQFSGGTPLSRVTYLSSSTATAGIGTESNSAIITPTKITAPISDRIFIFVTKPGINISERNSLLENKTFFDFINPSLGYPLDIKQNIISTILNYQDIIIEGNTTVQTGRYNIIITNNGTKEGKPQIVVRVV